MHASHGPPSVSSGVLHKALRSVDVYHLFSYFVMPVWLIQHPMYVPETFPSFLNMDLRYAAVGLCVLFIFQILRLPFLPPRIRARIGSLETHLTLLVIPSTASRSAVASPCSMALPRLSVTRKEFDYMCFLSVSSGPGPELIFMPIFCFFLWSGEGFNGLPSWPHDFPMGHVSWRFCRFFS